LISIDRTGKKRWGRKRRGGKGEKRIGNEEPPLLVCLYPYPVLKRFTVLERIAKDRDKGKRF